MIPASLFPPSPERIIQGVEVLIDQGFNLGVTIARLCVDFAVGVLRFVV